MVNAVSTQVSSCEVVFVFQSELARILHCPISLLYCNKLCEHNNKNNNTRNSTCTCLLILSFHTNWQHHLVSHSIPHRTLYMRCKQKRPFFCTLQTLEICTIKSYNIMGNTQFNNVYLMHENKTSGLVSKWRVISVAC